MTNHRRENAPGVKLGLGWVKGAAIDMKKQTLSFHILFLAVVVPQIVAARAAATKSWCLLIPRIVESRGVAEHYAAARISLAQRHRFGLPSRRPRLITPRGLHGLLQKETLGKA